MKPTTNLEIRLWGYLKRITQYDPPDRLRKRAEKDYGVSGDEAIEMAYDNVRMEAANALKGVRPPEKVI